MTDSRDIPRGPATEADPLGSEGQWVSVAHAARVTHTTEPWILDRCHDGRLPSRPSPGVEGPELVVPLITVRAFADGDISD